MSEAPIQPNKICRTCLKRSSTFTSLNDRLYEASELTISETIKKCLSIQLIDGKEQNIICFECVTQVKQTQIFYDNCVNAERIFGSYVSLTPIKQESNEIKKEHDSVQESDDNSIECMLGSNCDENSVKNEVEDDENVGNDGIDDIQKDKKKSSRRYCCNYCNESFTANHLVVDHLYKQHNVCHLCTTRMSSKEQLAEHMSGCTFRVKCNVCDETYLHEFHCRKHFMKCRENYLQKLKSRDEPYSAIVSERLKCIDEQYKRFVVEQSNNVVCVICDTIVPKKLLRLHLTCDHEDNNGELTCRLCHRKLPHYIYVKKHMERMHGDMNNDLLNGGHFDLVQHFRVTNENKRKLTHKCVDCTETYDLKRDLTRHRRQTHKACPGCDKSFKKRAEFSKHRLVCVALECEICHDKFKTHAQTNKHFLECAKTYLNGNVNDADEKRIREKFESVSKSQMKRCAVCEENVAIKAGQTHRQKHLHDVGYFKCAKCELTSDNYQTLYDHYQTVHANNISARSLRTSRRIVTCQLCQPPSTFATFRDFRKHIAHNHADKNGRIACNICAKTYNKYRTVEAHLTVKHNVVIESKRPRDLKRVRDTLKDGFICPYCGLSLKAQRNLLFHIRYKHTKERPEVCEICSATFVSPGAVRKHTFLKHTEKHLECDECDKKFTLPYFLSEHKRRCHGRENHPCPVCNKIYKTRRALRGHMIYHGERTFVCKCCDKSFYSNRHLRRHMFIHTGEKPIVCRFCPEAFVQHTSRKLHEQRYHMNELLTVKMENHD